MALSDDDLDRLGSCVELAREGLDHGDEPFGSILIERGAAPPPVAPVPITTVAPGVLVDGPANGYAGTMKSLYEAKFRP